MLQAVYSDTSVDAIYLNFSKAYDTVPHKCFIKRLKPMKINESLVVWIGNWLLERKQRMILRDTPSKWIPAK